MPQAQVDQNRGSLPAGFSFRHGDPVDARCRRIARWRRRGLGATTAARHGRKARRGPLVSGGEIVVIALSTGASSSPAATRRTIHHQIVINPLQPGCKRLTIRTLMATYVIFAKKREVREVWGGLATLSPKLSARSGAWTPSGTAGNQVMGGFWHVK